MALELQRVAVLLQVDGSFGRDTLHVRLRDHFAIVQQHGYAVAFVTSRRARTSRCGRGAAPRIVSYDPTFDAAARPSGSLDGKRRPNSPTFRPAAAARRAPAYRSSRHPAAAHRAAPASPVRCPTHG